MYKAIVTAAVFALTVSACLADTFGGARRVFIGELGGKPAYVSTHGLKFDPRRVQTTARNYKTNEAGAVASEDASATVNLSAGQAITLALGGVPDASGTNRPVSVGTGIGYIHGTTAFAVGVHARFGEAVVAKIGVGADSNFSNYGGNVGIAIAF